MTTVISPELTQELMEGVDHSIACENSAHGIHGDDNAPAAWIMWFSCCPHNNAMYLLACTPCKDYKIQAVLGCPACGKVFDPGSKAYLYIEPLGKT